MNVSHNVQIYIWEIRRKLEGNFIILCRIKKYIYRRNILLDTVRPRNTPT